MARAASPSTLDTFLETLKAHDVKHEIDNSPRARKITFGTQLTYTVLANPDLAIKLAGDAEFTFNADGSVRSVHFNLKPRDES